MISDRFNFPFLVYCNLRASANFIELLVICCEIRRKRFYEANHILWCEDASSFPFHPPFWFSLCQRFCRLTFLAANVNMR